LGVLSAGTHTVYVKYLKDGSVYNGEDTCGIHVRFGGSDITPWVGIQSYYYLQDVSGASYNFESSGDSSWPYWSNNRFVSNSAALTRVYYRCNGFDHMYLDVYCFGESTYDFGLIGTVDGANFSTTNATDSTNVLLSTSGSPYTVFTADLGVLPAGFHSVCVKYKKDGSVDDGTDCLYINPRINGSAPDAPAAG